MTLHDAKGKALCDVLHETGQLVWLSLRELQELLVALSERTRYALLLCAGVP